MEKPGAALPPTGDRCLVGSWNWSWPGGQGTVTVYNGGNASGVGSGQQGTWSLVDSRSRTYRISWPGNVVDTVALTPDCRSLSGSNNSGVKISATRAGGTP